MKKMNVPAFTADHSLRTNRTQYSRGATSFSETRAVIRPARACADILEDLAGDWEALRWATSQGDWGWANTVLKDINWLHYIIANRRCRW